MTDNNDSYNSLVGLINEVVLREFGEFEKQHPSHGLKALLDPKTNQNSSQSPEELEKLFRNLLKRKHGTAAFKKDDMELLDKLTRWMKYIPGGTSYRRNLAKYLRSKRDPNKDPFRDFRKYTYDNDPALTEDVIEDKEASSVYYHGTSKPLKIGGLVLPPSQTGKMSEKGRKKNLDVVFLTKDPRSALIYAGRAANSLGGKPVVYVVEPQGPVSELNGTPGTTVFYSPYAKVIRVASKDELKKK